MFVDEPLKLQQLLPSNSIAMLQLGGNSCNCIEIFTAPVFAALKCERAFRTTRWVVW